MKKIAVFTGTRAEYGLMYWLLKDIQADLELCLQLIVSGSHLSPEFGNTYDQIERDGFEIDEKIEMLLSSNTAVGVAKSMGLGTIGFADALSRLEPDILVILGDRFEALAIAQVAMVMKIPILHIHGGERTDGAYDDAIRHAVTKLSTFHATSHEVHRKRVIQLGEAPHKVWNVGAIGLEHLSRTKLLSRDELSDSLNFIINAPFFLVTYHPVTLACENAVETFTNLLNALDQFPQHQVILTYPNADDGGREIIQLIEAYARKDAERVFAIESLGQLRYLSALSLTDALVGNSSSGIIEAPAYKKPTINIGSRQEGRLGSESILHCSTEMSDITDAIQESLKNEFLEILARTVNPYGHKEISKKIIKILKTDKPSVIKNFVDIQFE